MFMGRTLRTRMPALESSYKAIDQEAAAAARRHLEEAAATQHDKHSTPLPELQIGDKVLVWSDSKKNWSIPATVETQVNPRSYTVMTSAGTRYRRNREQLRPHTSLTTTSQTPKDSTNSSVPPPHSPTQTPRRSARLAAKSPAP